jgi:hypothetical protein
MSTKIKGNKTTIVNQFVHQILQKDKQEAQAKSQQRKKKEKMIR